MAFQSSRLWSRPLVFAALILILVSRAHGQCYFPGGNWAQFQSPCDPYAFTSQCCPQGYACFSNHLCVLTDTSNGNSGSSVGSALRGTCTNPRWDKDACGTFCLDDPVSDNSGRLVSCGDNKWCCGPAAQGGTCNCDSGSGTFSVQSGKAQTVIGSFGSSQTTLLISFSSRQTPSSTTEHTATAISPASPVNTSSHSTTTVSPLSTPSSSSQKSSPNIKVKASLGTIFPVFVLVIIIIAYILWWRRKRDQNVNTSEDDDSPTEPYQPPNQPLPGRHPYDPQTIGAPQGDEPIYIVPDQDDNGFPPAVTPSPTPRSGPFPSYSRLTPNRFQPRERTTNVAKEENLQRRYTPDPWEVTKPQK